MTISLSQFQPPLPSISYVVTSYNHPDRLDTCLRAIRQSIYPNYEIIVSDDGSSNLDNRVIAKKHGAKWITHERLYVDGVSTRDLPSVFNQAWPLVEGEIVQTLQQDHIIAPDFGVWLARTFEPSMMMIGATDHTAHEFTKKDLDALLLATHLPDGSVRHETSMFSGRRVLVELLDWRYMDGLDLAFWRQHIQPLDEKMVGNGHYWMDFLLRLALTGLHMMYNPMMRLWNQTHSSEYYTTEDWPKQVDGTYDYMKEKWGPGVWLTMPVASSSFRERADGMRREKGLWKP